MDEKTRREEIGARIRYHRERLKLTRDALAELLNEGHPQTLYRYERGIRAPDAVQLLAIAEALGVPPAALLQDEPVSGPFPQPAGALVPVLGEIPAGTPMERALSHHAEDYLRIDPAGLSLPGDTLFALRVVGDSMIGACILPGDYAVCSLVASFEVGDVVAVYQASSGEATVKQLGSWDRKTGRLLLVPFNVGLAPFSVRLGAGDQVRRVVAVVRRLPVRAR